MNESPNAPCFLYSPFTASQVRIRLKALVETFPTPPLLTRREIAYPQVVVRIENEQFQLSQRKSYLNPWEPVLVGGVLEATNQGALVVGEWTSSKTLEKGEFAYRMLIGWSIVGILYLCGLLHQSVGANPFLLGAIAVIVAQTAISIGLIEACKRRYSGLSSGEKEFLVKFLMESLQANPLPPVPDSPDPAFAERMESSESMAA